MSARANRVQNVLTSIEAGALELSREFGESLSRDIPEDMTFRQWCDSLEGLKVDGHPFSLANRQALWGIYDAIPTHPEDAYGRMIVVQKGAQTGMTIWEMLANLYMARKWAPCTIGFYVPEVPLAGYKSRQRFMPIVRTIPSLYKDLTTETSAGGAEKSRGEGNVLTRNLGESRFLFLWTSGSMSTESYPMDVVSFDEVQGMTPDDIDRTRERLSASRIRFMLALSTAKWPDADINFWYKLGSQLKFHTLCPHCGEHSALADRWPDCVAWDPARSDYRYCCPECDGWIEDTQEGKWLAEVPAAKIESWHFPQTLSPTVSAAEMMGAWQRAITSLQKQNFYNRKLGLPYADPDQIPISMAILNQCVADGLAAGLTWKTSAKHTFMGIDQMGQFNVVIIKERMDDGRQATIHVEAIYDPDPFVRCSVMMKTYGVQVCVVESLPNYNDAKRFAGRHRGKVFLAHYQDIKDEMLVWGDAIVTKADRRTTEEERDRYTVGLNQYKCMQVAMARMVKRQCLFPDPDALEQDVPDAGRVRKVPLLREMVFLHFTKTALVIEQDEETRKYSPKVVKVGLDPHFSYANMLCDVAWARAHGTTTFILPQAQRPEDRPSETREAVQQAMPGLPASVTRLVQDHPEGEVCGRCESFDPDRSFCNERQLNVGARDPGCVLFIPSE